MTCVTCEMCEMCEMCVTCVVCVTCVTCVTCETRVTCLSCVQVFIKTNPPSCFSLDVPQPTKGGVLSKRCGLSFAELCKYKYLLNVGSNGYANKLRFLFLCGSVVIWVRDGSLNHEFFERQFVPGIHYAPVDTVADLPDAVRRLQRDDGFARQVALAGQQRMAQMDVEEVTHYCYQMLKGYAAIQKFVPKRDPRSWEVRWEDDLIRHPRYVRYMIDLHASSALSASHAICTLRTLHRSIVRTT